MPEPTDEQILYEAISQVYEDWQKTGDRIRSLAKRNGIKVCSRCKNLIEPGTYHSPFNGNQMFACSVNQGEPPDPAAWKDNVVVTHT